MSTHKSAQWMPRAHILEEGMRMAHAKRKMRIYEIHANPGNAMIFVGAHPTLMRTPVMKLYPV